VTAHLTKPSIDGLPAGGNSGIADARVFGEYAFFANRPDMNAVAITLEKQPVSGANAQEAADFDGHGDLTLAGDFGLLLHGEIRFLTLA
jgi:hypothetical protein